VQSGWGKEGDEATHEGLGDEGEGCALLWGVLVAAINEATKTRLRHRAPRAVPAQPLEALSVVAVHGGVRVKREAIEHRDAP